ncbi:hypothetical protein [Aliivibrio fischeri]|uniref:Uncharacterized protein n=1 Tax=Aliivibrio fischeri TaxID=668 RepID=A0A844P038_ALIFS|nr:hypothetical protein [Aliivibrio fischeri]MUK48754.1 hypothetical protein [Aliivibrio fischeri]
MLKKQSHTKNYILRIIQFLCFLFFSLILIGLGQLIQLNVNYDWILKYQQIEWTKNNQIEVAVVNKNTAYCLYSEHIKIIFNPSNERSLCVARLVAGDLFQYITEMQQQLIPAWPLSVIMTQERLLLNSINTE